jgi:hypothetical protein
VEDARDVRRESSRGTHASPRRSARIDNHVDQTKRVRTAIRIDMFVRLNGEEPRDFRCGHTASEERKPRAGHAYNVRDISVHRLRPIIDTNVHVRSLPMRCRIAASGWIADLLRKVAAEHPRFARLVSSCFAADQESLSGTLDNVSGCFEVDNVYGSKHAEDVEGVAWLGLRASSSWAPATNVHAARLQDAGAAARAARRAPARGGGGQSSVRFF